MTLNWNEITFLGGLLVEAHKKEMSDSEKKFIEHLMAKLIKASAEIEEKSH